MSKQKLKQSWGKCIKLEKLLIIHRVELPFDRDENRWIAENTFDVYFSVSRCYAYIGDICTDTTCPTMCAGTKFTFLWEDGKKFKKPTEVPAPLYGELLLNWVGEIVENKSVFPLEGGYIGTFSSVVKSIWKRLARVFYHIFYHHWTEIQFDEQKRTILESFVHLYFFSLEFHLLREEDFEPVKMLIEAIPEGKMCRLSTAVEAIEQKLAKLYEGNSRLSILVTPPKLDSSLTSRTISNSTASGNKMESTVRGPKAPPIAPLSSDLKAKIDRVQPNSTPTQAQITRTASGSNLKNLMNALNSETTVNALDLKSTTPTPTPTSPVKDPLVSEPKKPSSAITPPTTSTPTTVAPSFSSSFLSNSASAPATYNSLAQKGGPSISSSSNTPTIRKEQNFAANAKRSFFVPGGNNGLLPAKKSDVTPSSSSGSGVNLRPTAPQPSTQANVKKDGVESLN